MLFQADRTDQHVVFAPDQEQRQRGARRDRSVRPIDPIGKTPCATDGSGAQRRLPRGKIGAAVRPQVAQGRKSALHGGRQGQAWSVSMASFRIQQLQFRAARRSQLFQVGAPSTGDQSASAAGALAAPCSGQKSPPRHRVTASICAMVSSSGGTRVQIWFRRASRSARLTGFPAPSAACFSSAPVPAATSARGHVRGSALHLVNG